MLNEPDDGSENPYQKSARRIQRMIEFKELRSGQDMAYHFRRLAKMNQWSKEQGSMKVPRHLVNQSIRNMSYVQAYDMDIKVTLVAFFGLIALFTKGTFSK